RRSDWRWRASQTRGPQEQHRTEFYASCSPSVAMGAVRPVDDGVLEEEFVVGLEVAFVVRVLEAEAAELARVVFDQRGRGAWRVPEIVERAAGQRRPRVGAAQPGIAQADAPLRHELVDALRVPAPAVLGLADAVEESGLVPVEHLARQREVLHRRIAARC